MNLRRTSLVTLVSVGLSLAGQLFLPLLPLPLSLLDPVLMLAVSLCLSFRFRTALAAALGAGVLRDILSPQPFGLHTLSILLVVGLVILLVVRFVSHRTAVSVAGLNILAAALMFLLVAFLAAVVRVFGGGPFFHPAIAASLFWACQAVILQGVIVLLLRWVSGAFRLRLERLFLVSPKLRS